MPLNQMDIKFPVAGVVRRGGLRTDADRRGAFPAPWAVNMRLMDTAIDRRLRGGSFQGRASVAKGSPVYRDRAITFSSNAITAARQGDSSDTTLSTDISDTARPILFQLSEAADTGATVVAVIPHKDAYLICFTSSSVWVLSGDPATGSLRRVSDQVGLVGASAWCVFHDTVYFMDSNGLHMMNADGSNLTPISEELVPVELSSVGSDCVLTYNYSDQGVYITLPSATLSWFYDTRRGGLWPYQTDITDTSSHVLLGPFRLGQANAFGRVVNLHGNIAASSADVTWRLVIGETAEDAADNGKTAIDLAVADSAFASYVSASGTWAAGRANMAYPRTRAIWCCLWLASEGDWAFEECIMTVMMSGRWKGSA